ncbi:hypothetical protein CLNEO_11180 [Anaerotignum neopropionicum]|uniref:Uncharacterized protein n=1 Tax=Anaerotignum neopropionicum TaxID=36847 RepID=A0A136WH87_9FIRM|nr:hypothetical protein [Anaerotignum neopropionicum]KXL53892.1 hypothetical protein CLNEO_11180 [Anaerotignum neopropionicum]
MDNQNPRLHVVIYYQSNSKVKTKLHRKLIAYAKKISDDPYEPYIDISMDNSYLKKVKAALQTLTCDTINTFYVKRPVKDLEQLYLFIKILLSITLQKSFENTPNNTIIDNWMIISIIPSKTSDIYDIKCSLGK